MAIRTGSMVNDADGRTKYQWSGLLNGDSGTVMGVQGRVAEYVIQASGTFGAAGSVALQGSNDGVNFLAMKDASNTTVALTTLEPIRVAYLPQFIRPLVTAGDGTTSLQVNLIGGSK